MPILWGGRIINIRNPNPHNSGDFEIKYIVKKQIYNLEGTYSFRTGYLSITKIEEEEMKKYN
jgi:hypothetical protein